MLFRSETVVGSMHVNEMLDVLGMFHSVTLLPKSWSSFQDYKCTCSDGHKYCVCEHGLLLTYLTNRKVKIPAEFQNTKVAQRMVQFRGRPKKGRNPQRRLALEDVIHVSSATDQAVEQEAELEDGDEVTGHLVTRCQGSLSLSPFPTRFMWPDLIRFPGRVEASKASRAIKEFIPTV